MDIEWHEVSNLIVLDRAELVSIQAVIQKARLSWIGHVTRMDSCRLPRKFLCGELVNGTLGQDHPKKHFIDTITESRKL